MAATTVLPEPTSPSNNRFMGLGVDRSVRISSTVLFWDGVREKGRLAINRRIWGYGTEKMWESLVLFQDSLWRSEVSCSKSNSSWASRRRAGGDCSGLSGDAKFLRAWISKGNKLS